MWGVGESVREWGGMLERVCGRGEGVRECVGRGGAC